jgi:hypothetical protein
VDGISVVEQPIIESDPVRVRQDVDIPERSLRHLRPVERVGERRDLRSDSFWRVIEFVNVMTRRPFARRRRATDLPE